MRAQPVRIARATLPEMPVCATADVRAPRRRAEIPRGEGLRRQRGEFRREIERNDILYATRPNRRKPIVERHDETRRAFRREHRERMVAERERAIRARKNRLVPAMDAVKEAYCKALDSGITHGAKSFISVSRRRSNGIASFTSKRPTAVRRSDSSDAPH